MDKKLEKVKVINIKGDEFTLDITKLSVNHFLSIEIEKQILGSNQYGKLAMTFFPDSTNAASLIDMMSTLRVLAPEIEESLETKSFLKVNLFDMKDLLEIYKQEVNPWYRKWMNEFSNPFEEESEVGNDK